MLHGGRGGAGVVTGRTVLLIAAIGMGLLLVFGGVALAKSVACKAKEPCVGTDKADEITATNKADKIRAKGGDDTIDARAGKDVVSGGDGNDTIDIADGVQGDLVDCGPGDNDTVIFDEGDRAAPGTPPATGNCENFDDGNQPKPEA